MQKIDDLALHTGIDIPFLSARITIHNPKIKEIAYIGEENFYMGIHFLCFDRNKISAEDNLNLDKMSDFEIFMNMINDSHLAIYKTNVLMVLALLFPQHKIKIDKNQIILQLGDISSINDLNYEEFKSILQKIFCLNTNADGKDSSYNPADGLAKKIAEKIQKGKARREKTKGGKEHGSIYGQYISILSVGLQKSKRELSEYTVYQLRDELVRFQLKEAFDMNIKARLAGAKDVEEADNWMKDIHS